jgi:hypothetical protein
MDQGWQGPGPKPKPDYQESKLFVKRFLDRQRGGSPKAIVKTLFAVLKKVTCFVVSVDGTKVR